MAINYSKMFQSLVRLYSGIPHALLPGYAFPVLHVCFELTHRCNLSCEMCQFYQFADAPRRGSSAELSYEEVISVIDQLPSYTLITFTGGELFLRKDIMKILEYCRGRRRFTVVTNGTLINQEKAEALVGMATKSFFGKGLFLVEVSLEGPKDIHESISKVKGSYEKTVEAIRLLTKVRARMGQKFPVFNIKTVITSKNAGQLVWLYEFARKSGTEIFNPMVHSRLEVNADRLIAERHGCIYTPPPPPLEVVDTALLQDQIKEILRQERQYKRPEIRFSPLGMTASEVLKYYRGDLDIRDYNCRSPWYMAGISPYGYVTACIYNQQETTRNKPFKEIWNSKEFRNERKMIKQKKSFPGCLGCCNMTYTGKAK